MPRRLRVTRRRPSVPASAVGAGAAALLVVLAACGSGGGTTPTSSGAPNPQALTVVVGFYPLQYAAEQVGGDTVSVANLTPPGAEPHDLELTPQQVAQISEADLVIYISGFQPALDEAVAQQAANRAVDVLDVVDPLTTSGATDPHILLDPVAMAEIGAAIADRLVTLEPAHGATIADNLGTFAASMTELNGAWTAGTATCVSRDLVVSHEAFGYLARAYHFDQIGISGLSPDAEPSPATIAEISTFVRDHAITTIYYETLVDPKVAQTIAAETGASTAVLDPIEGLPVGSTATYVTLMQANLATLITGQQCS